MIGRLLISRARNDFVASVFYDKAKRKNEMEKSSTIIPIGLLPMALFSIYGTVVLLIAFFIDPVKTRNVIAEVHVLPVSSGN